MTNFDRFTEQAQEIARASADKCLHYHHNQIDIEHLLLALLEQPEGVVSKIMFDFNIDTKEIIKQLDKVLQASPKANIFSGKTDQIFLTPRVKYIIDIAGEEAEQLNDERISSEHIFLSIFKEKNIKTPASRILKNTNLTYEQIYGWMQNKQVKSIKLSTQGQSNFHSLQVFLCHSSEDKPKVRELYQQLSRENIVPWLDEENLLPGHDWQIEIPKAVKNSDIVLVCLSKNSITKTGYVQKEIKQALDIADEQPEGTVFIIPLKLEECDVPARLRRWQWVNLFDKNGYQRLLYSLNARLEEKNKMINK